MYNSKIYVIESIHIDFGKSTVHRIGGMFCTIPEKDIDNESDGT